MLIFTQYADTAQYIFDNINPGGKRPDIESIYGTGKSKARMAARFSPVSNQQINVGDEESVNILVATDVMSEGLNLQDCDVVVNYDLHWNPVRLIQRFGRIDRIGTENERVWGFNFLPELKLERNLGLHDILRRRIQEIHDTIGEDAAILDKDEQINEEAMFAIYEKKGGQLSLFEEEETDLLDISEAEEFMRSLREKEPSEYQRIASLRDGIRSARGVLSGEGRYILCQAGKYQQLFLTDAGGQVVSRDVPFVLGRIKCSRSEPAALLPQDHNKLIMKVLNTFSDEVRHRRAQLQHSLSLTVAQNYALRELRAFYSQLNEEDTDLKAQVVRLEEAFKRPLTAALKRQMNSLRRNGVTGHLLVKSLTDLYHDHGLQDRVYEDIHIHEQEAEEFPRIICSEALV